MASYHQYSNYQPSEVVQHDTEPHPRAAYIMPTTLVLHPAALQVTETNVIAPTEVDKRAPVVPRNASPKYTVIPTTVDIDGLGRLTPGALYSIPAAALPTAQAILNQTYRVPAAAGAYAEAGPRWYSFAIVPRRPEYSGRPSLPMLAFSVDGLPGVPLRALRDLTADDIDGAGVPVFFGVDARLGDEREDRRARARDDDTFDGRTAVCQRADEDASGAAHRGDDDLIWVVCIQSARRCEVRNRVDTLHSVIEGAVLCTR